MGKDTNARKLPLLARATVTSKGQITIPSDVRRALGLEPGDQLGFRRDGRVVALPRRVDLAGSMPPRGGTGRSLSELRAEVSDELAERHAAPKRAAAHRR